jgi:hypothetical protein
MITVFNHAEILKKNIKVDIAFSYSSFEHDGLGRYGDPLSPDGDLRAMQEAHTFLKDDGILFLGVPFGPDCLTWNAHRIYGKHRLPLLLKGWKCLDVFNVHEEKTKNFPFDLTLGKSIQFVLVCKKVPDDYPEDEYLLGQCIPSKDRILNKTSTSCPKILEKINKIIFDYKKCFEKYCYIILYFVILMVRLG